MSISMYFAVSWLEPRLQINESATEWTEDRTGPLNVRIIRSVRLIILDRCSKWMSLQKVWSIFGTLSWRFTDLTPLDARECWRRCLEWGSSRTRPSPMSWGKRALQVLRFIRTICRVRITISCRMNFDNYPLDSQTCQFQVGSCKYLHCFIFYPVVSSSQTTTPMRLSPATLTLSMTWRGRGACSTSFRSRDFPPSTKLWSCRLVISWINQVFLSSLTFVDFQALMQHAAFKWDSKGSKCSS